MEGAATTVYAQGGRGNARLVAWEGERTVTFTMEDALISPEGFMILSGAGLVEASKTGATIKQHMTETIDGSEVVISGSGDELEIKIPLSHKPYLFERVKDSESESGYKYIMPKANYAYVMFVKDGEIITEPYIPEHENQEEMQEVDGKYIITVKSHEIYDVLTKRDEELGYIHNATETEADGEKETTLVQYKLTDVVASDMFDSVIVDYYVERDSAAQQIEITADKFGGNYYLEASTLFRNQNGVDLPAEFIIPNCKVQSNFTFTMASSGDPSTFTFTMDAFPDYTRFDHSKKVLAAIQIIEEGGSQDLHRHSTAHASEDEELFI